jgi:hypothetical protein
MHCVLHAIACSAYGFSLLTGATSAGCCTLNQHIHAYASQASQTTTQHYTYIVILVQRWLGQQVSASQVTNNNSGYSCATPLRVNNQFTELMVSTDSKPAR